MWLAKVKALSKGISSKTGPGLPTMEWLDMISTSRWSSYHQSLQHLEFHHAPFWVNQHGYHWTSWTSGHWIHWDPGEFWGSLLVSKLLDKSHQVVVAVSCVVTIILELGTDGTGNHEDWWASDSYSWEILRAPSGLPYLVFLGWFLGRADPHPVRVWGSSIDIHGPRFL